jgi:hypothetical protein
MSSTLRIEINVSPERRAEVQEKLDRLKERVEYGARRKTSVRTDEAYAHRYPLNGKNILELALFSAKHFPEHTPGRRYGK